MNFRLLQDNFKEVFFMLMLFMFIMLSIFALIMFILTLYILNYKHIYNTNDFILKSF